MQKCYNIIATFPPSGQTVLGLNCFIPCQSSAPDPDMDSFSTVYWYKDLQYNASVIALITRVLYRVWDVNSNHGYGGWSAILLLPSNGALGQLQSSFYQSSQKMIKWPILNGDVTTDTISQMCWERFIIVLCQTKWKLLNFLRTILPMLESC